jgi:hypothetical protein
MTNQLFSKVSMIATLAIVACSLLMSGAAAAQAQSNYGASALSQSGFKQCTNRTLSGDYGFVSEGVLLPAPGVSLQFRSTGMAHFDGKGNLTWVEHTVINGVLLEPDFTTAATGSYAVDPDCTGTATVNTPNSPVPLNLGFVVVKQGSEVHAVLDTNAISTAFTKVD